LRAESSGVEWRQLQVATKTNRVAETAARQHKGRVARMLEMSGELNIDREVERIATEAILEKCATVILNPLELAFSAGVREVLNQHCDLREFDRPQSSEPGR